MEHVAASGPAESNPSQRRGPRRAWLPLAALVLAGLGMLLAETVFAERLDRGVRNSVDFALVLLAAITLAAWFFFAADVSRRARVLVGAVLATAAIAFGGSVRRVEFSGDMVPTFDFRWRADRGDVLERHRDQQRAEFKTGPGDGAAQLPLAVVPAPYDVLEFRGPRRDGIIPGPALERDWSARPPRLAWRQPVGGGYASFVVVGPTLATIEQRRAQEAIVCYDAGTGRELWVHEYPALFSEVAGGDGPRATPAVHDGRLYALGATGELTCLDYATGRRAWSVNILQQNESANLDWAMSGSPLVYDGLVLVVPGAQQGGQGSGTVAAYAAADGTRRFAGGGAKASYASPMLVTLDGELQLLVFSAPGLEGYDAGDGRPLWRFDWTSDFDINAAQPVVVDDRLVLITSDAGVALVEVAQTLGRWTAREVWRNRNLKGGYASPIVYDGHVYGIDGNLLACLELATGKRRWKGRDGQFGHGQLLARDDLLLVLGEAGELALVEMTPERFHELGRIQAIEGKTWNVPALVGGRIFVRNHLEMAAYDLPLADEAVPSAAPTTEAVPFEAAPAEAVP